MSDFDAPPCGVDRGLMLTRIHLDAVDSTNDEATRLLAAGKIDKVAVIVARGQTHGRGSKGRTWVSPYDAGIYLTVVQTCDKRPLIHTTDYTRSAGQACADCLRRETGVKVLLRSVNDLYAAGGKLGGLLTEAIFVGDRFTALVIGVGINTRAAKRNLPDGTRRAISLEELMSTRRFRSLSQARLANKLATSVLDSIRVLTPTRASV